MRKPKKLQVLPLAQKASDLELGVPKGGDSIGSAGLKLEKSQILGSHL